MTMNMEVANQLAQARVPIMIIVGIAVLLIAIGAVWENKK